MKMLEVAPSEISEFPFPYFVCPKVFDEEESSLILNWFEEKAPWKLVETDFYEQYEFDLLDVNLPQNLTFLKNSKSLNNLAKRVEDIFRINLSAQVDLIAHKLLAEQTIRIHNDYIEGKETHRIVIQLNRGWKDENGGFLMFFNSADPSDINRIFRPLNNTLIGFEISPKSYHAVSTT